MAHTQLSDQEVHTRTRILNVSTHVVSDLFMKILLGLVDVFQYVQAISLT